MVPLNQNCQIYKCFIREKKEPMCVHFKKVNMTWIHLSKKFTSKLTRAGRERKFLTIFQTFEWIFLQNIQKITKYV